ncbi:MAG: uracil-DNA glycosylase family protein [Arcobacteraceae bacterium]
MKSEIIHILKMKKLIGIEHISPVSFSRKKNDKLKLPDDINIVKEYVDNCALCELSKSKSSVLFAKGNGTSKIYIIGLNYNYNDDKKLSLITKMVENVIHIDINNTYMTNILKCTSTKMQNNFDDEVDSCIQYLEKQIIIGAPKLIITLGNAFDYMIKTGEDIMDASGNLFSYNGIKLMPLMDPEFIYKNPSYKEKMFNDLQKIKKIMDDK